MPKTPRQSSRAKCGGERKAAAVVVQNVRASRQPRFSIVSIVRNEAPRLPRLMASLAEFRERGGEIVVVDTGSDDDTLDVARSFGCRVFSAGSKFESRLTKSQAERINRTLITAGEKDIVEPDMRLFNFGKAREYAASLARNPYQLAADGSDVIDAMDIDALNGIIASKRAPYMSHVLRYWTPTGWQLYQYHFFCDRRVFRWQGRAHGTIAAREPGIDMTAPPLPRDQLSVSHYTQLDKPRSTRIASLALDFLAEPTSPRWTYYMAHALVLCSRWRSALALARNLDREGVPGAMRSLGLCLVADCEQQMGASADEVERLLFLASKRASGTREPLLRLAKLRLAAQDFQGAVSFAAGALAIKPSVGLPEAEDNHTVTPHEIMYWSLFWLGRRDEAQRHLAVCLAAQPKNPTYLDHLRIVGRTDKAPSFIGEVGRRTR